MSSPLELTRGDLTDSPDPKLESASVRGYRCISLPQFHTSCPLARLFASPLTRMSPWIERLFDTISGAARVRVHVLLFGALARIFFEATTRRSICFRRRDARRRRYSLAI